MKTLKRFHSWLRSWMLLILAIVVAGCGTLITDKERPHDWPNLATRHIVLDAAGIWKACRPYSAFLDLPLACSLIDFEKRTCTIYLARDADALIVEHEEGHCKGWDHPGSRHLREAWENYKKRAENEL